MGRTVRFSFMTLVYAFLYLPIIVLIVNSFNANKFGMKWGGFTTKWYETLVNNDSLMQANGGTLLMLLSFLQRLQPLLVALLLLPYSATSLREKQRSTVCCLWL